MHNHGYHGGPHGYNGQGGRQKHDTYRGGSRAYNRRNQNNDDDRGYDNYDNNYDSQDYNDDRRRQRGGNNSRGYNRPEPVNYNNNHNLRSRSNRKSNHNEYEDYDHQQQQQQQQQHRGNRTQSRRGYEDNRRHSQRRQNYEDSGDEGQNYNNQRSNGRRESRQRSYDRDHHGRADRRRQRANNSGNYNNNEDFDYDDGYDQQYNQNRRSHSRRQHQDRYNEDMDIENDNDQYQQDNRRQRRVGRRQYDQYDNNQNEYDNRRRRGGNNQEVYNSDEDPKYNRNNNQRQGRGNRSRDQYEDHNDEDNDNEDYDDEEDNRRQRGSRRRNKGDQRRNRRNDNNDDDNDDGDEMDEEDDGKKMKKVITHGEGGAAVDECFDEKDCQVLVKDGTVYAVTLNQSNISHNNNKFYIIQVLESTSQKGVYFVWNRWGRVGVKGQNAKRKYTDVDKAIKDYEKKLRDKSVKGDYIEVEMDEFNDAGEENNSEETKDDEGESGLPIPTKDLIKLIFDLKMMNAQMKEIGYDAQKMPLGKLSQNAIDKGYEALDQISNALATNNDRGELERLSSEFYSLIPHDFGFRKMAEFVLDNTDKVKEKLDMLASLQDIHVATKLLDSGSNKKGSLYAENYEKLKCQIEPLGKDSDDFRMILDYVRNTHADTHSGFKLEVIDVFKTNKEGEDTRYKKELNNKMLLWHGSRLTNYVGILSQGLRIAPPEAPASGYMFGKGVYFADMVSKSANYCCTSSTENTGIMLLCEVALGNYNEKTQADSDAAKLPQGKHSTKGVGSTAPPESSYFIMDGDVAVPLGKGESVSSGNTSLLYNEYIVYDLAQIKLRYLLKMKFNYGH